MTSKELRRIRKRLDWTQKQLAETVGIAPNALAMQERGEIGISEPVSRLVLLVAGGVDIEAIINPRRGGRGSSSKTPKRSRVGHSQGSDRKGKGDASFPRGRR
ncbi:MAG: helix-turn-helix domain-containing protein [Deltaproteobacteria bacterium]|nr:helix-turn-helix domain-containing protein [Deltaproteobacteria bacterium]MCH7914498.1 helix-turn-helix domain-containing protein [Deltaproteobacteria bacterium]